MPSDHSELERVYDAVTSLTAEVRAFMERLVRLEALGTADRERFDRDVMRLQADQAATRLDVSRIDKDLTGVKTKVAVIVAAGSLGGGALATIAMKLLKI